MAGKCRRAIDGPTVRLTAKEKYGGKKYSYMCRARRCLPRLGRLLLQYAIWQLVDAMSTHPDGPRNPEKPGIPVDALNLAISFCFAKSTEGNKSRILYEEITDETKHPHRDWT